MNILIIGSGKGSWTMRGEQLGAALDARVLSMPTLSDFDWADVVVLVKRAMLQWGRHARRSGKPVVWDALDFWAQPAQNRLDESAALALLRQHIEPVKPALVIGATQAMAQACGGVYVPHHGRAGLTPTDARKDVQTVGYDGGEVFLEAWGPALRAACAKRGWRFVVNPANLAEVDILVALRGGVWDGWICREWKSGVKAVNAILAGRPLITQASAAVREIEPLGSIVEQIGQLEDQLEFWSHYDIRQAVVDDARRRAPHFDLVTIAMEYRAQLAGVLKVMA